MFSQVMETVEPWYVSKEVYPTKVLLLYVWLTPAERHEDTILALSVCLSVYLSFNLSVFPSVCMGEVFRVIPEFRILRLTFHRKSAKSASK